MRCNGAENNKEITDRSWKKIEMIYKGGLKEMTEKARDWLDDMIDKEG